MKFNLALIGFGGVNQGLVEVLQQKRERLAVQYGLEINIVAITDMRIGMVWDPVGLDLDALLALPNNGYSNAVFSRSGSLEMRTAVSLEETLKLLSSEFIDVVVEATYTDPNTGEPALSHCSTALSHGKHVITTNKGPIALAGNSLQMLAHENSCFLKYEGAVMSGTPVLRQLSNALRGCEIDGFSGILNGTSNFVLGRVESGATFGDAIREAQHLGYAEADPTADVEGHDVQLKVTILANALWNGKLHPRDIPCRGISALSEAEVKRAAEQGAAWKLLGQARRKPDGSVEASVAPQLLPAGHPLLAASGVTNAITFDTDLLGLVTICGPGAGRIETAFAILSDLIELNEQVQGTLHMEAV